jgi:hypothetical protein
MDWLGRVHDKWLAPVLALAFGLTPGLELRTGARRRRHGAIDDHALGEPDGGLNVPVLSDDMLNMGEAMPGGVLDAPSLSRPRPLHLAPHLAVDGEVVGLGIDPVDLDHAKAPAIYHRSAPFCLPPPFQSVDPSMCLRQ